MATAPARKDVRDYVREIVETDPKTALEIAIKETERVGALYATAQQEYRAMAELEFDQQGRIVKANMAGLWRLAKIYASSDIVPDQYRRKEADCFIACQMAFRLKVDPFAYMQNTYMVKGRPGLEGKMAVALLNTSGKITGRISYKNEGIGNKRKCTAMATDAGSGETVEATVDWATVEAEGWNQDKGTQKSKWTTMPDVMFHYRAATFLIRRHYPEVLMGIATREELEDISSNGDTGGLRSLPRTMDELADELGQADADIAGSTESTSETSKEQTTEAQQPDYSAVAEPTKDTLFSKSQSAAEA